MQYQCLKAYKLNNKEITTLEIKIHKTNVYVKKLTTLKTKLSKKKIYIFFFLISLSLYFFPA